MSRRDDAIVQTRREIERQTDRARRAQRLAERAAERDAAHDREDRELENHRMRAVVHAEPEQRQRIEDRYDAAEVEMLRERAAAAKRAPIADLDGGRGAAPEQPWTPTWQNPSGG
jgi:hypothetical protein